jgi:hypothetical protein
VHHAIEAAQVVGPVVQHQPLDGVGVQRRQTIELAAALCMPVAHEPFEPVDQIGTPAA